MNKIGSLKLEGELFLAPMADYTNVAFRTLCKEYGAALVYTELISAKAIVMKSKKTEKMILVSEKEKPVFLQLFGSDPKDFEKAISFIEKKQENNFAGYDLNCGCSVKKAFKGNYGCSLMKNPPLIEEIIKTMKKNTNKPVTLKMRLGFENQNFLEVAKIAENAEIDAITLHPRLGNQGYSKIADWAKILELKKFISVPLIGNGDIKTPTDIIKMKKETSCDFEMIGRASIGNAFFFKQGNYLLRNKKELTRTKKDAYIEAKKYLEYTKEFNLKTNDIRPYFIGLAKGFDEATKIRNAFALSKSIPEIEENLEKYFY